MRQMQDPENLKSKYGADFTPFEAILSTFGFKLQPQQFTKLIGIRQQEFKSLYSSARQSFYRISKQYAEGKISKEEAEERVNELYKVLERGKIKSEVLTKQLKEAREKKYDGGKIIDNSLRLDGTKKSQIGWKGRIKNNVSGKIMTELSAGRPNTKEGFYPLINPYTTDEQLEFIKTFDFEKNNIFDTKEGKEMNKNARKHYLESLEKGVSPFVNDNRTIKYEGGEVEDVAQVKEEPEDRINPITDEPYSVTSGVKNPEEIEIESEKRQKFNSGGDAEKKEINLNLEERRKRIDKTYKDEPFYKNIAFDLLRDTGKNPVSSYKFGDRFTLGKENERIALPDSAIHFANVYFNAAKALGYSDNQALAITTQAAQETGYGAKTGANSFGIKAREGEPYKEVTTHEEKAEGRKKESHKFYDLSNGTVQDNIQLYTKTIKREYPSFWESLDTEPYSEAIKHLQDIDRGGYRKKDTGYATDKNYLINLDAVHKGVQERIGYFNDTL